MLGQTSRMCEGFTKHTANEGPPSSHIGGKLSYMNISIDVIAMAGYITLCAIREPLHRAIGQELIGITEKLLSCQCLGRHFQRRSILRIALQTRMIFGFDCLSHKLLQMMNLRALSHSRQADQMQFALLCVTDT